MLLSSENVILLTSQWLLLHAFVTTMPSERPSPKVQVTEALTAQDTGDFLHFYFEIVQDWRTAAELMWFPMLNIFYRYPCAFQSIHKKGCQRSRLWCFSSTNLNYTGKTTQHSLAHAITTSSRRNKVWDTFVFLFLCSCLCCCCRLCHHHHHPKLAKATDQNYFEGITTS